MDVSSSEEEAKLDLEAVVEAVKDGGRRAVHHTGKAVHAIVSFKWVQRVVVATTLLGTIGTLLYIPAAISYLVLYYKFLPQLETTVPVHLQYGVGPNPFGIASLDGIVSSQPYDFTVSLTLPRSPANLDRGNFMIALHLLSRGPTTSPSSTSRNQPLPYQLPARTPANKPPSTPPDAASPLDSLLQPTRLDLPSFLASHTIVYTAARPAIIPYVDPLAALATRLLFLPYHLLSARPATATVHLTVPVVEDVTFSAQRRGASGSGPPLPERLLLEVQAGQDLQVYEASVTVVAKLRGLRGVMYRWRVTAFVLFTVGFWVAEAVLLGTVAVVVLGRDLGGLLGGGGEGNGDDVEEEVEEEDDDGDELGPLKSGRNIAITRGRGTDRGSSLGLPSPSTRTSSSGGPVKREPVKKEEGGDRESELHRVPVFDPSMSAEADDEAESGQETVRGEASKAKDVGVGTSYRGHTAEGSARKRAAARQG